MSVCNLVDEIPSRDPFPFSLSLSLNVPLESSSMTMLLVKIWITVNYIFPHRATLASCIIRVSLNLLCTRLAKFVIALHVRRDTRDTAITRVEYVYTRDGARNHAVTVSPSEKRCQRLRSERSTLRWVMSSISESFYCVTQVSNFRA